MTHTVMLRTHTANGCAIRFECVTLVITTADEVMNVLRFVGWFVCGLDYWRSCEEIFWEVDLTRTVKK